MRISPPLMQLPSSRRKRALRFAFVFVLVSLGCPAFADAPHWVIPPHREQKAQELIADVGFQRELPDGYRFEGIALTESEVVYDLQKAGVSVAQLRLVPAALAQAGDLVTPSFAVQRTVLKPAPEVDALLDRAAQSVVKHDDHAFYVVLAERTPPPPVPPPPIPGAANAPVRHVDGRPVILAKCAAVVTVLFAFAVLVFWRRRPDLVSTDFRLIHFIPVFVQTALYLYWGTYWAALWPYMLIVLSEVVFAYLLDAATSLYWRRRLVLSFAPIPVVFSTNLFVQFQFQALYMPLTAIAIAFLAKGLFRWKSGPYEGHIFNPSALGVTVIAIANLLFPSLGYGDTAFRFDLPPNISEVIFLFALLPQVRRPIVLITLFAALAMFAYRTATGIPYFHPLWAPVLLSLTLLGTDPATTPRSGAGRFVFGVLLGFGISLSAMLLDWSGNSDFYGKVLVVPFLNLAVPWCDRVGNRLHASIQRVLDARYNIAHVAIWALVFFTSLTPTAKGGFFSGSAHADNHTPLIKPDPDGTVTCAGNPTFCQPFSFVDELHGWLNR